MHSSIYLGVLIVMPLVGALVAMLTRKQENVSYYVAVATATLELALTIVVAVLYNNHLTGRGTYDFMSRHVLSAPLGLAYDVGVDGISLFMVVLTALVLFLSLLGARERRREASFVGWLLLLTSFTMASFVSHDVLEFFIFFELTLGAELLHHRELGWRPARPRGAQVLHLHLQRFGVLAHRHLVPRLRPPAPDRGSAHLLLLGARATPRSATACRCGSSSPSPSPSR